MNREYKFRAWDLHNMHYGVFPTETSREVFDPASDVFRKVEGIMQFTGLKDKNGVDVYEGDVVKYKRGEQQNESDFYEAKEVVGFSNGGFKIGSYAMTDWYTLHDGENTAIR